MGDLTEHFSRHEFDCHDGTPVPPELIPNLVELCVTVLEPIRSHACSLAGRDVRMTPLSGYRTVTHNEAVGGEPGSMHLYAKAADIWMPDFDTGDTKLWGLVRAIHAIKVIPNLGGFGRYVNRVHVDTRPHQPGVLVEWDNRTTGKRG